MFDYPQLLDHKCELGHIRQFDTCYSKCALMMYCQLVSQTCIWKFYIFVNSMQYSQHELAHSDVSVSSQLIYSWLEKLDWSLRFWSCWCNELRLTVDNTSTAILWKIDVFEVWLELLRCPSRYRFPAFFFFSFLTLWISVLQDFALYLVNCSKSSVAVADLTFDIISSETNQTQ